MAEIGALLLILAAVGFLVLLVWLTVHSLLDRDIPTAFLGAIITVIFLGACLIGYAAAKNEHKNPCISWGPPQTTYVMVGNVLVPTTYTPCVRRQNEVEK